MENMQLRDFDKELTTLYSRVISLCLDYSGKEVDIIYVLGTNVANKVFKNKIFLKKDDYIFRMHELNNYIDVNKDVSDDTQIRFLQLLNADLKEIYELFIKNNLDAPTEIELKYIVTSGKFAANLSYDKRLEEKTTLSANDIFDAWLEKAKQGNDGFEL